MKGPYGEVRCSGSSSPLSTLEPVETIDLWCKQRAPYLPVRFSVARDLPVAEVSLVLYRSMFSVT